MKIIKNKSYVKHSVFIWWQGKGEAQHSWLSSSLSSHWSWFLSLCPLPFLLGKYGHPLDVHFSVCLLCEWPHLPQDFKFMKNQWISSLNSNWDVPLPFETKIFKCLPDPFGSHRRSSNSTQNYLLPDFANSVKRVPPTQSRRERSFVDNLV